MARARLNASEALVEQSGSVLSWLQHLPPAAFAGPSVLPDWDVRTLTGHLVLIHRGLLTVLGRSTTAKAIPLPDYVRRYRRDVAAINEATLAATGDTSPGELVAQLSEAIAAMTAMLSASSSLPRVVDAPRGPINVPDFIVTKVVEVVVHADDLSQSLADRDPVDVGRSALAVASRALASILAGQHPGRSIEVRVPPFAAVQCGVGDPGPTHTRGTPPNVVETDALTFLRLCTGRMTWAEAIAAGAVHASGLRANLTPILPVLS